MLGEYISIVAPSSTQMSPPPESLPTVSFSLTFGSDLNTPSSTKIPPV